MIMGMTIDETITALERDIHNAKICGHQIDQYEIAIDTMRKYQQIEQIINYRYTKSVSETLDEIVKVVEDGNDD